MPVPRVVGLVVPTVVAYAHLPGYVKAGPRVEDSIGRAMGGPVPRVCCCLQHMRVV